MAVEILESVKDDEVEEEQKPITEAIEPVTISLTGETSPDDFYVPAQIKIGEPEEPGFFTRAFDAFDEWRDSIQAEAKSRAFTREEAREITKQNIKLNRERFGSPGGVFGLGDYKPPSHSSLVRAGLEDPPEEEGEAALLPYLRDDPGKESRPKLGPEQSRIAKEQKKWKTYPKDPAGFLIDPNRPILMNEDGSSSSERTVTIEGDGRYFNVPSIINGERYDQETPEDFEKIIENAKSKMKQGWIYPNFESLEEAEQQAGARSDSLTDARAEYRAQDLPETEDEWEEYLGKQPSFTAGKGPDFSGEEVEEDPWGLVIWDHVTNTPAMFKRQYGGAKAFLNAPRDLVYILEAAADQGVAPEDSFALEAEAYAQGKDPAVYYQELLDGLEENEDFQEGMRLHREGSSYLRNYQPNVEEGSLKYYAGAILEGSINMAPALVTTALTRSPMVGAAFMGGQVFADQYVESIESGRSHSQAVMDSSIFAAAEILTERIPLGILTREGGGLLKRVLKAGGAEAIQEPITQLIQEGYTMGIINEEMTLGEALIELTTTAEGLKMLGRSAIIGFGVGGTLAGATHSFYRGTTVEDVPDVPDLKKLKTRLPSEKIEEISDEEAEEFGLERVEVSLDLLERVAAGDPLTIDEQYTLTNEGYGRFINDGERVVMDPKGMQALKRLREGKSLEDEEAREGVPRKRLREPGEAIEEPDRERIAEVMAAYEAVQKSYPTAMIRVKPELKSRIETQWGQFNRVQIDELTAIFEKMETLEEDDADIEVLENRIEVLLEQVGKAVEGEPPDEEIPVGTITDEQGEPVIVWRGEHGLREDQDEEFQTRVGSLSFGSLKTATVYAKEPNDRAKDRVAKDPRVQGYTVAINNPFVNSKDDPFVDLAEVRRKLGASAVRHVVENLSENIMSTNNWQENFAEEFESPAEVLKKAPERVDSLYLDLYSVLDDPAMVKRMKRKGYDGAIHQGMGENFDEIEYRVFDPAQAKRIPTIDIVDEAVADKGPEVVNKWSGDSVEEQRARLTYAAHEAETSQFDSREQSDELLKAGTYEKGHIRFHGLPISIENPAGSTRRGKDPKTGRKWKSVLPWDYGYIKGVKGRDKDQMDIFMGPNPQSQKVFIVNQRADHKQVIAPHNFDEHKVMLGFDREADAVKGYRDAYPRGWEGHGSTSVMTLPQFKKWIDSPFTQFIAPELRLEESGTEFAYEEFVDGGLFYMRNTEPAPDVGERFQQHIEPAGTYVLHDRAITSPLPPGWVRGEASVKWPLLIPLNSKGANTESIYDQFSWKRVLSDQYGGLTGQELSSAIRADGFDAIITVNIDNKGVPFETREIVLLKRLPIHEASTVMTPTKVSEAGFTYEITDATLNPDAGVNTNVGSVQAWLPGKAHWEFTSPKIRLVETGVFRSGKNKIVGTGKAAAEQVAHVVAPLRREAQESLMLLMTDEKGNIKSIVRHSVNNTDSASLEPAIAMGSMFATKGARRVWMVHQHPTGNAQHSEPDTELFSKLKRSMEGTGITVESSVVVTHGQGSASWHNEDMGIGKNNSESIDIPPMLRTEEVVIKERRFRKYGKPSKNVLKDPMAALDLARTMPEGEHIILLNTAHHVVGTVPVQNLKKMRTGNVGTGAGAVLRAAALTNANTMIAVANDTESAINAMSLGDQIGLMALDAAIRQPDGTFKAFSDDLYDRDNRNYKYKHKRPRTNQGQGVSVEKVQDVLRPIYRLFRTVPPVRVVESIEDLPKHLQAALETEEDRKNTTGMYDQGGFLDTVYVIANNVTDTQEAIETMLHEVIGHFGLHQVLDPWDFNAIMDQVSESFEKQVRAIAKTYGLDWNNVDERRIAAEEYMAHTAQRLLAGRKVGSKARQFIEALVKAFKNFWLRATGKPTLLTDGQIYSMIAQASDYVQKPGGYARDKRRGRLRHVRTPTYFSKLWTAFNDTDMKSGSAGSWKQFIQGQIKKGGFKDVEARWLRFTVEDAKDPEQTTWFDDVVWNDIYQLVTSRQWSGPAIEDQLPDLEKYLPRDMAQKIVEQRRLGAELKQLKDKAEEARNEGYEVLVPGAEDSILMANSGARLAREEWYKEHPPEEFLSPNEQRDYALMDEQWEALTNELETFGRTQPKKIPKDAVMTYIERNMVAITVDRPRSGGDPEDAPWFDENYPDHEDEPNEDDWYDTWSEISEQHWDDYYPDNLDRVYDDHKWNKFREEEQNEELGEWDGTSPDDMEEEAREMTVEEIEGEYYEEARDEWQVKNTRKEWYSGDFQIATDSDGDFVVSHEGDELGYDSNFDSAVQIAQEHHNDGDYEGSSTRWKSYMLDPKGEDYEELLFTWNNPGESLFTETAHWSDDDANYVAHVRFDVRKDENGNPTIYIDEMQSDWAQAIRDRIEEKAKDIYAEHGWDDKFLNPDGSVGGGPEWDGTSKNDMIERARRETGADPEKAKKWEKDAEELYKKLELQRDKVETDLMAPRVVMNRDLIEALEVLVQDDYAHDAQNILQHIRVDATKTLENAEARISELTDRYLSAEMEKAGLYHTLTWAENMLFTAYRIETKLAQEKSSMMGQDQRDEFFAQVIDRSKQQFNLTDAELNALDTSVALKDYEAMYEIPKEGVGTLTWQEVLYQQNRADTREWEAHPEALDLWDMSKGNIEDAVERARADAHESLMDEGDTSPSATQYRRAQSGTVWQDAWFDKMESFLNDEQAGGYYAGQLYKVWVPLSEALDKVATGLKSGLATLADKVDPFDFEFNAENRNNVRRAVLDFDEARTKTQQYKDGIIFPPFEKDWQLLVIKSMLFEAMQRGHDRLYISKGEPHGVRWSGAETVDQVVWAKNLLEEEEDQTIDSALPKPGSKGQTFLSYSLTYPDTGTSVNVPVGDMRKTLGDRVARAIKQSDGETGTVRAEDLGLKAILIPSSHGGQRLTGSRKNYNEIAPNNVNKFLKQFKTKMVPTYVPGPGRAEGDVEAERSGLHVRRGPAKDYDDWAKAKIRPLTDQEIADSPLHIRDYPGTTRAESVKMEIAKRHLPPPSAEAVGVTTTTLPSWDGTVWGIELGNGEVVATAGAYRPTVHAVKEYHREQLKILQESVWGYEAFEIEFTDELKAALKTGFPLFHKRSGKKRTGDPGLDDALNWAEKNIGPQGPRSLERLQRTIFETLAIEQKQAKLEQAMLDQFAGLKWAIRQTHGHDLPAQVSAYKQAHFTTSQDSQMFVFLTHGIPVWETVTTAEGAGTITQIKPGSKGLLEIMEPVADRIQFWGYWMAARRANRLLKEGREALFTQERVDELLKLGERFPEFQDVADAYNDWKTQFLDWAEGAGVINSETRPLWDQADYVPFYRVKSDELGGSFAKMSGMGGPGIANVSQPIKRLLGSKHPLGDILENIIVNFQHIADTTMKNKAAQLAVENLEGSGLIVPISGKEWMKQEFIPLDELKRKLKQAGVDWEAMDPEALAAMQKMWTLQRPEGEDVISVLYDGKKKYFRVKEETLLRSLTAINEVKFSSLLGRMGMWLPRKIKRLGTTMITLAPDFMAANWFRDLFMAFTNSRHAKMPKPFSGISGAWKALSKSPEMVSMMAAGGAFYSGYINANDPVSTVKAMKRALRQTGLKNRILDAPWKLFHLYNDIGAASENANRIGSAYIPAIKAGAGKAEAVWESKDLMNFAKHGDHVAVQFFAQSVMFLNARVQGLTRYGQRFAEAPGITFAKSLMYSMAVLALWLRNKDEDWYKALPEEDKDMNVHVMVNGKHWRLPKAFEVGMIFGVGVERMFEYFYSNEDDAGKVAIDRLWFVIGEVFNFFNRQTVFPLPQFIQPLFEASTNWNAFFQSPIVPEYMMDIAEVKPELAFRAQTSPAMRELAKAMPGFAPDTLRNPILLEHLVRGYFGTLGAYVMVMTDGLVRQQFDYPARPALRWSQIPVVKRFYRGDEPPSRTNYEEIMYEVINNARQIERAVNQMERLEMDDEVDEFMEAGSKYDPSFTNQEVLDAAAAMEGSYEQIKQLRKETAELWEDENMTPEQKLRELNHIYRDKMENAKDAYGERPGATIQFEALQETLIDMVPEDRVDFLAEQGLDQTADLVAGLPKKPELRLRNIYWENSV